MMRPRPHFALRRPHLSAPQPHKNKTRFTSLSRAQLQPRPLSAPLRLLLHPGAFLVHLSAITLASSLVPSLSASLSTSARPAPPDAREKTPEPDADADPPTTTSDPIPSPRQLHSLATLLRAQIAESPASASFTLRQLHMLRPPTLAVPPAEIAVPERWIWAEPATAVVEAFLAGGGHEKLEEQVVRIARNAVRWDQLVCAKIAERDGVQVDDLSESLQLGDGKRGEGLDEQVRQVVAPPLATTTPTRDVVPRPAPAEFDSPLSSLPLETLQELITFLVAHPRHSADLPRSRISSGLALAYALESLPFPNSSPTLHRRVISAAIRCGRFDLAARSWVLWHSHAPPSDSAPLLKSLSALSHRVLPTRALRNDAQDFKAPRIAALDSLLGVLERESHQPGLSPAAAQIVRLAVRIPRPFQAKGDREAPWRERHAALFARSSGALAIVIGDLVGREVRVWPGARAAPRVVVGPARGTTTARAAGFTTALFNSLIAYAVEQLRSERLAQLLYGALLDAGLEPTAASTNPLLPLLPSTREMLAYLEQHAENEWTLPTLLAALRTSADFALLDRLVFAVLPELDCPTSTERVPPLPGRSPHLYLTLLDAAVRAGRTGLAERIFRHARWAAVLSRLRLSPAPAWTLPAPAFAIMLAAYATEVRRGRRFAARNDPRRFAVGWARGALRAHEAEQQRSEQVAVLGPGADLRGGRRKGNPLALRQDAAQVAVRWDLVSGSRDEERASFKAAIEGSHARLAFGIVFPADLGEGRRRAARERWTDPSGPVRKRRMARTLASRRHKDELPKGSSRDRVPL